jgi:hypothetical protein
MVDAQGEQEPEPQPLAMTATAYSASSKNVLCRCGKALAVTTEGDCEDCDGNISKR